MPVCGHLNGDRHGALKAVRFGIRPKRQLSLYDWLQGSFYTLRTVRFGLYAL